jgi:hypothetical protein
MLQLKSPGTYLEHVQRMERALTMVRWASTFLIALSICAAVIRPVRAIDFIFDHDEEGEQPLWDPNGAILEQHFLAAADIWERALPVNEDFSVEFHWDSNIDGLGYTFDSGAEIFVEINPNACWFVDPTPFDNAEFDFSNGITLYRDLPFSTAPPTGRLYLFPGTPPPLELEVGFQGTIPGTGTTSPCFNATDSIGSPTTETGFDLLSTVVHELGHVLGTTGHEPGEYNIYPHHVGFLSNVLVKEEPNSPIGFSHLAGGANSPFLMGEGTADVNIRRLPSATDILVVAEEQEHGLVHLDRVDSITSGGWHFPFLWIGGSFPDATQDVFIRSAPGQITLFADGEARSLTIDGENNQVQTQGFTLTAIGGPSTVRHGQVIVDNNGEVELAALNLIGHGELIMNGGVARIHGPLRIDDIPSLPGPEDAGIRGLGTVHLDGTLVNNGRIRADGGTLSVQRTSQAPFMALDLDGDEAVERGSVEATAGDLRFIGLLTDDFDGEMLIGDAHSVTFLGTWTLGTAGLLHMQTPVPASGLATLAAVNTTIHGDVVVDGRAIVDSDVAFASTAKVSVQTSDTLLRLNKFTTYRGGQYVGMGMLDQRGSMNVEQSTTLDVVTYDWDGSNEAAPSYSRILPAQTFTINSRTIDILGGGYGGDILNEGGILEVNTKQLDEDTGSYVAAPWKLDQGGEMHLLNSRFWLETDAGVGARVRGAPIHISGRVLGKGEGNRVESRVLFQPSAQVEVPDPADELQLVGPVDYYGGSYTGDGTIRQVGDAVIQTTTTIQPRVYDWDGDDAAPSTTTIGVGRTLWLRPESIDVAGDGFDGLVQIHKGTLIVNTLVHEQMVLSFLPWTLGENGTIDLFDEAIVSGTGNPAVLNNPTGSRMIAAGQINASGADNVIYSPTTYLPTARVNVNAGGRLILAGPTRYEGGSYTGDGV